MQKNNDLELIIKEYLPESLHGKKLNVLNAIVSNHRVV